MRCRPYGLLKRFICGLLLALALAGVAPERARADGPGCECEQYRSWTTITSLVDGVTAVGIAALDTTTNPLQIRPDEIALRRTRLQAWEMIPQNCRERLRLESPRAPVVRLFAWSSFGDDPDPYVASSDAPTRLLAGYRSMLDSIPTGCTLPAKDASASAISSYQTCMEGAGSTTYGAFDSLVRGLPPQALAGWLEGMGVTGYSTEDMATIQAFHTILNSGSEDAAIAFARANGNNLSEEQWLAIGQMMGAKFVEGYDDARNAAGMSAEGSVGLGQLLNNGRDNEQRRFRGDDSTAGATGATWAGVCRDIASGQAQLLAATGRFDNVYVVSHATVGGSYHVTTIAQSVADRSRVYRLNYGERHDASAGDPRALFAGPRDVSYVYRIAEPGGRVVATQLSEFGNFLRRAAGGDIRDMDPLARARGSMAGAQFAMSADGAQTAQIGYGRDGNGAQYVFAGTTLRWGQSGATPGQLALMVGHQYVDAAMLGTEGDRHFAFGYLQLDQHFRPAVQIGDRLRLTSDTGVYVSALVGGGTLAGSDWETSFQGDLRIGQQFILDHQVTDDFRMRYRAGALVSPGLVDIRDNSLQAPIPALDHVFGSVEARYSLGDAAWIASAMVAGNDSFGARGRFETGIVTPLVGFTTGYEGRLGEGTAPFVDGYDRRIFGNLTLNPNQHVSAQAQVSYSLDTGAVVPTFGLGGSF